MIPCALSNCALLLWAMIWMVRGGDRPLLSTDTKHMKKALFSSGAYGQLYFSTVHHENDMARNC